jgi:hypothetical protein
MNVRTYMVLYWSGNYTRHCVCDMNVVYSNYSTTLFRLQKRIIRLTIRIRGRDSCKEHFRKLRILPLQPQYILSLLLDNGIYYRMNSEIHSINTRNKSNLHLPISNYQYIRRDHVILGLGCSIICLLK